MKKLRAFYLNLSLKVKLIFSSCLCFLLLFATCSVAALHIVDSNNRRLLAGSLASNAELSTHTISSALDDLEQLSYQIMASQTIQSALSRIYYADPSDFSYDIIISGAAQMLFGELMSFRNQENSYISYMILETDAITCRAGIAAYQELSDGQLEDVIRQAEACDGAAVWIYEGLDSPVLAREIREIRGTRLNNFGTLIIGIDIPQLVRDTTSTSFGENICLLYFNDRLLYQPASSGSEDIRWLQEGLRDMENASYKVIDFQDTSYFAVVNTISGHPEWSYLTLVPYQEYLDSIHTSSLLYYTVILISLLLSILLNLLIQKRIVRDLDNLILKMHHFHGQPEALPDFGNEYRDRTDELGVLHQEFDSMVAEIQHLIRVNYTNELLMKDAQLKALEMQINPHFLYNTLESINWRAKATGSQEISQMVEALGNLLRKTLSHRSQKNTLQEELELVRYYMTIMDLRFEDRLEYEINANETLLDAEIPTLTIQPLVENAANYALEEMTEMCYINIEVKWFPEKPFHFMILVRNTGTEFEENLLEKLRTAQIQPRGLGIGLLNIEERLRLTFGDDFSFEFYNEDGYAVARIILPYRSA